MTLNVRLPPISSFTSGIQLPINTDFFISMQYTPEQGVKITNNMQHISLKKQPTKKCKFMPEEDLKLKSLINKYGTGNWIKISQLMINKNPRQCRERWNNYLKPELSLEPWSHEEDVLLVEKYREYGNRWSKISKSFHNRSDNAVRNRLQSLLKRKMRDSSQSESE